MVVVVVVVGDPGSGGSCEWRTGIVDSLINDKGVFSKTKMTDYRRLE